MKCVILKSVFFGMWKISLHTQFGCGLPGQATSFLNNHHDYHHHHHHQQQQQQIMDEALNLSVRSSVSDVISIYTLYLRHQIEE
jgi:hypothetical protein